MKSSVDRSVDRIIKEAGKIEAYLKKKYAIGRIELQISSRFVPYQITCKDTTGEFYLISGENLPAVVELLEKQLPTHKEIRAKKAEVSKRLLAELESYDEESF